MANAILPLVVDLVHNAAHPLTGSADDYNPLLKLIGDSSYVLLGEASHGTHEFYSARAEITKRLVREKGFNAIAVEADWPDAYRINRYVQGRGPDADAVEALSGFRRFPAWMWRNADVLDFVGWLRSYNDSLTAESLARIGFYGLDLYSLHASIEAVLGYLDKIDPEGAMRARHRYACFEHFGEDAQAYGYATGLGLSRKCEAEVIAQLVDLRRSALAYVRRDGWIAEEDFFSAEQNARLVKNAEHYYRTMFGGRVSSWNLRDAHMVETFDSLQRHLATKRHSAKVVVWAHNSHLGDARATQMHADGEWNVGQLMRERYGEDACLVGFSTYEGTVTAASNWDGPAERKRVRPARVDSYEGLFHRTGIPAFVLPLERGTQVTAGLSEPMLERAIGVIYRPETERASHYFEARLSDQFDAVIHFDQTRAVEPLEPIAMLKDAEPAETFPSGI
ncbi:MAG: erythromycin esterase family protein [Acidobacteria bacterium]|nr:erythromycin esterase family protein [Acidobacteriota bacterium]MBW4045092.1 erythromycin esterase family protein [Acidobacteriota bacterium]